MACGSMGAAASPIVASRRDTDLVLEKLPCDPPARLGEGLAEAARIRALSITEGLPRPGCKPVKSQAPLPRSSRWLAFSPRIGCAPDLGPADSHQGKFVKQKHCWPSFSGVGRLGAAQHVPNAVARENEGDWHFINCFNIFSSRVRFSVIIVKIYCSFFTFTAHQWAKVQISNCPAKS